VNTETERPSPSFAASRAGILLAGGLLVIAALIAYAQSFSVPFVYDDVTAIPGNPTIRHLWPIGPVLSPPGRLTTSGRPVVNLSLAINYAFGQSDVRGYHALNLAIHILAGLILFGLVRRTLASLDATRAFQISDFRSQMLHDPATTQSEISDLRFEIAADAPLLAFTVAALWMLHPLQTESVTYIVQRAESLMGLFYLLTLYCFVRFTNETGERQEATGKRSADRQSRAESRELRVESGHSGLRPLPSSLSPLASRLPVRHSFSEGGWQAASILSCLLGMACKEVMVSAPLMVLLYDRTFVAGSFRGAWQKRRYFYSGLAASWLLLGFLVVSTGGNRNGSAGFASGMPWWTYALTQLHAIVHYLRLSLWPHPLIFDYGTAVVTRAADVIPGALIIAALAAGTVIGLRRCPAIGFLGIWFFAILAPSSSVVPVVTETMAEQRMYLPLAAVVVLVVLGIYAWAGRLGAYMLLVVAVLLGFLTFQRNQDYGSDLSIWSDTVAKRPENARAHNNLGESLSTVGRKTEAVRQYQEAVRLKPTDPDYHYNLATALSDTGQVQESLGQFEETLRLVPDYAAAHLNYGLALMKAGQTPKAIEQYNEALRINPDYAEAHSDLGVAFGQTGQMPEAIAQFKEALRIDPDDAKPHNNLGYAFRQTGQLEDALAQFNEALRINPGFDEARNNLALLFDKLGRTTEAIGQYQELLRSNPSDPSYAEAYYHLGVDLASLGRVPEAIGQLQAALRLKPDHAQAREKLAQLQAGQPGPAPVPPSPSP
jgi:tetratricopeptide (TPR) repeat protein